MSLYEGILDNESTDKKSESATSWNSAGLKLLHSQVQRKKAQATMAMRDKQRLASAQAASATQPLSTSQFLTSVTNVSVDTTSSSPLVSQESDRDSRVLIAPQQPVKPMNPIQSLLKPRKAIFLEDGPPLSFIPKAMKEEKVWLFGEVVVEDEYNPLVPNDFEQVRKRQMEERHRKRMEERKKETEQREMRRKEREMRAHEREEMREAQKRMAGAAIAPPQALIEMDSRKLEEHSVNTGATDEQQQQQEWQNEDQKEAPFAMPGQPLTGAGQNRGLGVAAKIMSKMGYKEGAGLGRTGQGMSTALKVEQVGRGAGLIIHEYDEAKGGLIADEAPVSVTEALKNPSKILVLKNMVGADEVDGELELEIRDEMVKYGQVVNVVVFQMSNVVEEETVRIFVEFTNVAQTIKALVDLNGRYFGGRSIKAAFYPYDPYSNADYSRPV